MSTESPLAALHDALSNSKYFGGDLLLGLSWDNTCLLLSMLVCIRPQVVLYLFGECPRLCTIYAPVSSGRWEGCFMKIFRFWRICRSDCHDDSLYLFVLVLFPDNVVPSIRTAFNIFYQHIVHVDWGVVYNHHICLLLSSDTSCSMYVAIIVVFLCKGMCQQQSGECWEILLLSSGPCSPSLNF